MSESDERDLGDRLLGLARAAALRAHAPYSRFRVGAALLADGRIFTGVNVENASFGLTVCAERVALFGAVAAGCRAVVGVAVSCIDAPAAAAAAERMPCGACRQVLAELAEPATPVWVDGAGQHSVSSLLPDAFRLGPG
jgi:cytidine deaminase